MIYIQTLTSVPGQQGACGVEAHDKQSVALSSVYASALLTVAKLTVGLATGSLGVLSEAAHSALDLGATIITYSVVRVSDKPAPTGSIRSVTVKSKASAP